MCGRTACTLAPEEVCKASSIRRRDKSSPKYVTPRWRDHPGKTSAYSPSCNVAPSRFTPILMREDAASGSKRDTEGNIKENENYIIQPMMWGFIPHFFKGPTVKDFSYKTNNCRVEDIEEKKIFLPALKKGQRCVVLCDGFYEWQETKGDKNKQPYFIFSPQPESVQIWNRNSWESKDCWSEEDGWKGPSLLKMAGLFSVWTSPEGEETFTYSVITMESGEKFSELHKRIPAILDTDEDVENWLDHAKVDYKKAISQLKNNPNINWHPVSSLVNNSRNQEDNCNDPISLKKKESASSKLMSAWLKKGTPKD